MLDRVPTFQDISFTIRKGSADFKDYFMNPLIYVTLISLGSHRDKEKNKGNRKNGMIQAFRNKEPKQTFNIAFSPLGNKVFNLSTDCYATVICYER